MIDPGPVPPENATPKERERWRLDNERFLTESMKHGASAVPASVDPTDKRLQALRREHVKFLDMHSPMKASIWLALLRSSKDVIHSAEMMARFRESQRTGRGDVSAPDTPAIIDIGNQLVAAALGGDTAAIERIAERIEGRTGLRVGDEAEDDPAKRRQASDITERVVRALTKGRLEATVASVIDVAVEVVAPKPKEVEEEKLI